MRSMASFSFTSALCRLQLHSSLWLGGEPITAHVSVVYRCVVARNIYTAHIWAVHGCRQFTLTTAKP